jgi:gamma-glutamyl-gamma-aminobutyrate hydrolase PuuD
MQNNWRRSSKNIVGLLPELIPTPADKQTSWGRFVLGFTESSKQAIKRAGAESKMISVDDMHPFEHGADQEVHAIHLFGSDSDVARYDSLHESVKNRLYKEQNLARESILLGKPVITVCGGTQAFTKFNFGVKMQGYIPNTANGGLVSHHHHGAENTQAAHSVNIHDPNSIIARAVERTYGVKADKAAINSTHSQGIHKKDFLAVMEPYMKGKSSAAFYVSLTATSDDGIVEAYEIRSSSEDRLISAHFQFHPELSSINCLGVDDQSSWQKLGSNIYKEIDKEISNNRKIIENKQDQEWKKSAQELVEKINSLSILHTLDDVRTKDYKEPFDYHQRTESDVKDSPARPEKVFSDRLAQQRKENSHSSAITI